MIERWLPLDRHGYAVTILLWITFFSGIWFLWLFITTLDVTPFTGDFAIFHAAANAIVTGALSPAEIYDTNLLVEHKLMMHGEKANLSSGPYLYPPTTLSVTAPFGLLDVTTANILWGGMVVACMGLSAWLLGARGIILAALAINPLTLYIAAVGHPEMFPVLALSVGLYLSRSRPSWAGAALSFMTLKPQLALVGIFLIIRQCDYRMLAGYAAGCAALFLVTSALLGFQTWIAFGETLIQFSKTLGFDIVRLDVMLTAFAIAKYFGASDEAAKLFHVCSIVVAMGIVLWRPTIVVMVTAALAIPIYNLGTGYMLLLVPTVIMLRDYPRSFGTMAFLICYAFLTASMQFLAVDSLLFTSGFPPVGAFSLWALLVIAAIGGPVDDRAAPSNRHRAPTT